jgi:HEAT repeat protein/tRNA A-37 threonylcarbamoyl transferase component Bud32
MQVCATCRTVFGGDARRCPSDGAAVEPVAILPSGARIGAYRIERMLGEGGMGSVYEATHEVLHRRSAIKLLRPELAIHPQIVRRFLNEAKAVNLIGHQNIVNIYDYGDDLDGCVYFVMEFLEGQTLDMVMDQQRPMPLPLLLHVFGQIAKALVAAHAKQIVHRDLKPANVYVVSRETDPYFVKLLDFGVAQLRGLGAAHGLTAAGSILGTPQYMSPEQISGAPVDARSDVWAMGVMLYRATTGCAPFRGEQLGDVADRILHQSLRPPGDVATLPAPLSELIASCLERRVEARCPSISELIVGLDRVKRACGLDDGAILSAVGASPAVGEPRPLAHRQHAVVPRPRSRRGSYALAGAAGLALGAVIHVGIGLIANRSIEDAVAAGDTQAARGIAESHLRNTFASGTSQDQRMAVEALALAHAPACVPLLTMALDGPPEVLVKAAGALSELRVTGAAPRLRGLLVASGDKIRVEIAAALYRLGDKTARASLSRALRDPATRLVAAAAMAESRDDAGRAVLDEILETIPADREQWRRAAGGLLQLGDAAARARLEDELAQSDTARSIGAAELLARAGDTRARERLARDVADAAFPRPGDAAAALARLGDERALDWVARGLASTSAEQRELALSICGLLPAGAAPQARTVARLATEDPDPGVRMVAEAVVLSW